MAKAQANCAQDIADAYRLNLFPERKVEVLKEQKKIFRPLRHASTLEDATDIDLRQGDSAYEYLMSSWNRIDQALATNQMFGNQLTAKERTSLLHQKDLLDAIVDNPELYQRLHKEGFDLEAYLRGTLDSDMGKLSAYQKLLLEDSEKGRILIDFLQGKGPRKSQRIIDQVLAESGYPKKRRSFVNPNLSREQVREYFKQVPAFIGYYHEFPGITDAIIAYEKGILTSAQFKSQLKANLFHNSPDEGFWKLLGHVIIPNANPEDVLVPRFLVKGTIFEDLEKVGELSYGTPSTFESFVAVFFDRMSQGSKGGYFNIDHELGFMDPLDNVRNLVLEESIDRTKDQLKVLAKQAKNSRSLTQGQKDAIVDLARKGSARLETYRRNMANIISMPRGEDGKVIKPVTEMTIRGRKNEMSQGSYHIVLASENPRRYNVTDLEDNLKFNMNEDKVRELIREELEKAMVKEERIFGDPMRSSYSSNGNGLFSSSPFGL
jgi:hypothetical protein